VSKVSSISVPAEYDAWYHSPRGRWIGGCEFRLIQRLLQPKTSTSLLDVGCGTGYFSRRFQHSGLNVTGIDPDNAALEFACSQGSGINYMQAYAESQPFDDLSFDYSSAITSLCFIDKPQQALAEMWRVTRTAMVLGLLNRHSLLYQKKHDRGSYRGARWNTAQDIRSNWLPNLEPAPGYSQMGSAIFFPGGNQLARMSESMMPKRILWGGFLVVVIQK